MSKNKNIQVQVHVKEYVIKKVKISKFIILMGKIQGILLVKMKTNGDGWVNFILDY